MYILTVLLMTFLVLFTVYIFRSRTHLIDILIVEDESKQIHEAVKLGFIHVVDHCRMGDYHLQFRSKSKMHFANDEILMMRVVADKMLALGKKRVVDSCPTTSRKFNVRKL